MYYLLIIVLLLYAILAISVTVFQRGLLYIPDKKIGSPEQYGLSGFKEHFVRTTDGISLQLWHKPSKPAMPTILYFHGNASHMGNRAGIYSALSGKGFGVLAVSYRGYGKSEGTPSEKGLYIDGYTALSFLTESLNISLKDIILYGESLGTGVATHIAGEYQVGAMVLQAPYTSVSGRAAEIYFFLPVKLLMLDHFDSLSRMAKIKTPLLIVHGEQDRTIPITHGKKLLNAANPPKESIFFHDVAHNNFDSTVIADHVLNFARKHLLHLLSNDR